MYKALIVDDEPLMRRAIAEIISQYNKFTRVYTAANGQEAVDLCREEKIDLIFMDIMMPVKDGISAAKEILESNGESSIYIISSYHSFELAQEALKSKIKQYMIKPLNAEMIREILKNFGYSEGKGPQMVLAEVFPYVEQHDFRGLYEQLFGISSELYQRYNGRNLKKNANRLKNSLFTAFFPNDSVISEQDESKLSFNAAAEHDDRVLFLWLFSVFDFLFVKRSCEKYMIQKAVFAYIHHNVEKDISLDDIVRDCNVSQGYLSRIFRRELNMTVMHYIHLQKINRAKEYICHFRMNISEIYSRVGYNEFSYFCKLFKKYENMTVSEYRRET